MWSWQDYISGVSGYTKVKIYLNDGNGKVNDLKFTIYMKDISLKLLLYYITSLLGLYYITSKVFVWEVSDFWDLTMPQGPGFKEGDKINKTTYT